MKILKLTHYNGEPIIVVAQNIEYAMPDLTSGDLKAGIRPPAERDYESDMAKWDRSKEGKYWSVIGMRNGETIVVQDRFVTLADMLEALQ